MRISDWSSDVCSSDLEFARQDLQRLAFEAHHPAGEGGFDGHDRSVHAHAGHPRLRKPLQHPGERDRRALPVTVPARRACIRARSWQKWQCPKTDKGRLAAALVVESMASPRGFEPRCPRSEKHTSELQSLMRISYAVF